MIYYLKRLKEIILVFMLYHFILRAYYYFKWNFNVIKILGNYITNKNNFFYFIADNNSHIDPLFNKGKIKRDKKQIK